jgi:hypothetical protein
MILSTTLLVSYKSICTSQYKGKPFSLELRPETILYLNSRKYQMQTNKIVLGIGKELGPIRLIATYTLACLPRQGPLFL